MRRRGGLRVGSIAGIDIMVDVSLVIIFFLITFSLATAIFPAWHPDWSASLSWSTAVGAAVLFFASVLAHELSHALVARAYGVTVWRITLFMFGGIAQMEREPPSWRAELSIAIVGPFTSLILGIVFPVLADLISGGPIEIDPNNPQTALATLGPVASLLLWLGPVNVLLAVFNLVPGFPLDGGRVLRAIMWALTRDVRLATRWASIGGQVVAWLLMSTGFVMILGLRVPFFGGGFINGLWITFIGWYLNNAALVSYQELVIRGALEHVPVRSIMQTRFMRVDPQLSVSMLIDEYVMASGQRAFPVEADGRFLGIVSLHDLQKCTAANRNSARVGDIMTPLAKLTVVAPGQEALEALATIGRLELSQLPVVQEEKLLGLLRREDILKWLSLHAGPDSTLPEQYHAAGGP